MSFQSPVFLVGLLLIPLLIAATFAARKRRDRYAIRLPSVPTLFAVLPARSRWKALLPPALLCLALSGLVLALARPERTVAVPIERASVMLVSDASGSMRAGDVAPTRMDAAKAAAKRFLDRVPDELRVGMVGFSTSPNTLIAPSEDHAQTRAAVDGLIADGGTATGDALQAALTALQQDAAGDKAAGRKPPAAIVLLSDGETTTGRDPVEVAREAARAKVPVYTVALGTAEGTIDIPGRGTLSVPPDPEAMRQIAQVSGGRSFEVDDADQLDKIYEELGSRIGTKDEKREVTAGFAAAGVVLLLGSLVASLRFTGRLP